MSVIGELKWTTWALVRHKTYLRHRRHGRQDNDRPVVHAHLVHTSRSRTLGDSQYHTQDGGRRFTNRRKPSATPPPWKPPVSPNCPRLRRCRQLRPCQPPLLC